MSPRKRNANTEARMGAATLKGRERRNAEDQIDREMRPILEVTARHADEAVELEMAMRTPAAMGVFINSIQPRGGAALN